jgi:hypothetical protein
MHIPLPDEFKKACRNLGQDLGYSKPSLELMAQIALIGIEHHERLAIQAFLDRLLSGLPPRPTFISTRRRISSRF